jgi:hypothetical protein
MVSSSNKTIGDIQTELEAAFARLSQVSLPAGLEALKFLIPPQHMFVDVDLRRKDGNGNQRKKIRSDADASRHWDPSTCEAVISFQPHDDMDQDAKRSTSARHAAEMSNPRDDLLKCLDSAERDSRFREFVGIKSFRDEYLVAHSGAWAHDPAHRHTVLANAIDQGLVLRSSVPNPKNPSFPTTSIRVNREHPEVKRILAASTAERVAFNPIPIIGAELSSTVLSERR